MSTRIRTAADRNDDDGAGSDASGEIGFPMPRQLYKDIGVSDRDALLELL